MPVRLPPLESLRVFEASARHGSFTRAAEEIGVTPAAISLRIRDLEAELGQALFVRKGPRIALTDGGAELAARMGEILTATRDAVAACRAAASTLKVAITPSFVDWLAARLPRFHEYAPGIHIRLDASPELRPPDRFDLAIRSGYGGWPDVRSLPLLPVLGTPMLSPALAEQGELREPADLQRLPLLPDTNWRGWFRQAAGIAEPRLDLVPTVVHTQDMLAAGALRGTGAALLSPVLFGGPVAEGRLVRPFESVFVGPERYYLVRPAREARKDADRFAEWLFGEIAAVWSEP